MTAPQHAMDPRFSRKITWRHSFRWGLASVFLWLLYVTKVLFNLDLIALLSDKPQGDSTSTEFLIFAIIGTVICTIGAIIQGHKAIALARNGTEVTATISKRGLAFRGLVKTECSYVIGDDTHIFTWTDSQESGRSVGDTVPLLVDPKDPKRCILKESIYPETKQDANVHMTTWEWIKYGAVFCASVAVLAFAAWDKWPKGKPKPEHPVAAAPAPAPPPQVPRKKSELNPPSKDILFQPMFVWENADSTLQGTGFFVKAPGGRIAAVTSAHFLDMDGPHLLEARWLNLDDNKPIASFKTSWGPPGKGAATIVNGLELVFKNGKTFVRVPKGFGEGKAAPAAENPVVDQRTDYLLLPSPVGIPAQIVLELDPRTKLEPNEPIWFHDKDSFDRSDYKIIEGEVATAAPEEYEISLDEMITPKSQSGSPVISQTSGKVIGIVASIRGNVSNTLFLTPSYAILKALKENHDFPQLRDVVGDQSAEKHETPANKNK